MRLRFSQRAERQLVAISAYIARDSETAARRVVRRVRAAALNLTEFPESGRQGAVAGTREWTVRRLPYIIVYRADPARDELIALQVFHGARERHD